MMTVYRGRALPLYGSLIVADESIPPDDGDLRQALEDAFISTVGGSRFRVAIRAAQDTLEIAVTLQMRDAAPTDSPDDGWVGPRTLTIEVPTGTLVVDNFTAGFLELEPGPVSRLSLPGGPGLYRVAAWHRGREEAAARVKDLWEQDEVGDDIAAEYQQFAGIEQYRLQIWPVQPSVAGGG